MVALYSCAISLLNELESFDCLNVLYNSFNEGLKNSKTLKNENNHPENILLRSLSAALPRVRNLIYSVVSLRSQNRFLNAVIIVIMMFYFPT